VHPVGGAGGPIPVVLTSDMFVMGVLGGMLSLAVLLASSINRARMGIVESLRSRARPPTLPLLQRYYVDLLPLAALAFLLWEIKGAEGFLTRDLASGDVNVNFLPLFVPVLVLVVVAVLVLRLLPMLVRFMSWWADRLAPAWVAFPLARFARDPLPPGYVGHHSGPSIRAGGIRRVVPDYFISKPDASSLVLRRWGRVSVGSFPIPVGQPEIVRE